jgi:oligopeptide/dipeptide ABC transporter ATP-binding protein
MSDLLKVEDLHVSFSLYGKELQAVRGVSFEVNTGESVGIVGESGSGKSAAVQSILRLTPASKIEGKAWFEGADLLQKSETEMRQIRGMKIGMVFQEPMASLNPTMTIGAQVTEGLIYHKVANKKKAKACALELLQEVEINRPEERLKQYPHELSGGMRQRVLIAIALSHKPRLLIADEPTTALDVTVQAQILDLLKKRSASTGLLLITHDLAIVAEMCERVLVFYAGKIVEQGPTSQILAHPRHPYTQMLLRSIPHQDRPRSKLLESISGAPLNLFAPQKGCPFLERCPQAAPICKREPPFVGTAACWRPCD